MYGKFFSSAFTGSMFGAGSDVFAVWAYVIANTVKSQVELNPKVLAAAIGMTEDRTTAAITYLCQPDANSRSKIEDGKRLIRMGQFTYQVPTYKTYLSIRNEDDRREYNRKKQAEHRSKPVDVKLQVVDKIGVKPPVIDSQTMLPPSAHKDRDKEESRSKSSPQSGVKMSKSSPDERAKPIREAFKSLYPVPPCPWDASEEIALNRFLAGLPKSTPAETVVGWFRNYFQSANRPHGERARVVFRFIMTYAEGPLDKFGRLVNSKPQALPAVQSASAIANKQRQS